MAAPALAHHEYRCAKCDKLFFKGILIDSEVEVKCKRCGEMNLIKGVPANKYVCLIYPCPRRISTGTGAPEGTSEAPGGS
ncbi:MAG: Com family DNA-binding transcriptional regulator [bacterium]|nr:Com family DNA-binding transcriptional regulator [bacterium]